MIVVEVGCMGTKPGTNVMDEKTFEGAVLKKAWDTVVAAPGGPKRVSWGLETNDPSKLWAFFEWNSIEEHREFARVFGAEAVKDLPNILSYAEFSHHVVLKPPAVLVLEAPSTEMLLAYFPSNITIAQKQKVETRLQEFLRKGPGSCLDSNDISYGWGVENEFPVRGLDDAAQGSLLMALVGWSSSEARLEFRNSEAFREAAPLLQGMEGLVSLVTVPISCSNMARNGLGNEESPPQ